MMKKGRKKKLVVWLLALSMLLSSFPGLSVSATGLDVNDVQTAADADEGLKKPDTSNTDVTQSDTEPTDTVTTDQPKADDEQSGTKGSEDSDESKVQDVSVKADESAKQEDSKEPEEEKKEEPKEEEDEEVQGGLINYLAIGQAEMQAPGEQYVIVSYGNGTEEISSVKLVLTGDDGKQKEIPLTEKEEASYRFVKTYDESEAGIYHIDRFSYVEDGRRKHIDLEKTGISAQFTIQAGAVQSDDEECEQETGISVTTLTSDDISDDMTSEIEQVIQEGADEAVENVQEGVVELGSSSTDKSYSSSGVSLEATAKVDAAMSLGGISTPRAYTGTASSIVVVLDPGHGGSDQGASANGLVEKDINLYIAKFCKKELEKHNGITVYMTRDDDRYVSLDARVQAAKLMNATLFVSIHMNSTESNKDKAKGAEVYYPNSNYNPAVSNEGKNAAQNILNELVELGLTNRGIKIRNSDDMEYADGSTADYYQVIRDSKKNGFPGIIVEHAFLTNEDDADNFLKEDGTLNATFLQQLGQADAQGILKYCQTKTDYSPVYDFSYYVNRYPDVKSAFGNNPVGAMQHFVNYGMSEGRQGSKDFSVDAYRNRYSDLATAFGTNNTAYYLHYINFGRKEGRVGTTDGSNPNAGSNAGSNVPNNTATNTIYSGVDYGDVYDYEYYITRYKDLAAVFTGDYAGALKHFVQSGMTEGRQAKGTFNVLAYKANYPDLAEAFGVNRDNLKLYFMHYIDHGKEEGREKTLFSDEGEGSDDKNQSGTKPDRPTQYGLIDYQLVYDFDYYVSKYSDVRQAYGNDPQKVLQHFIRHGMDEGRSGNGDFNVYGYQSRYADLRAAYGNDLKKYYLHYINHGEKEGRRSDIAKVTSYQGVDYSAVYDFDYYMKKYSDLEAAFGTNPAGAIEHFIKCGVNEGRQAKENFSVYAYKNNYADLRRAFGDNNLAYVRHYIEVGMSEGRDNTSSPIYHRIMMNASEQSTYSAERAKRVNQMVTYFLANSTYPTYYANNTNVKGIKDFCELYYTECLKYGVNPEVAFCQAMKETAFLKFGGDVKKDQYNFAGLGATGGGASGAEFKSIQEGIRAQVQHLAAYATEGLSEKDLADPCVDPRFQYVRKGSAPYVEWLGQKENPFGEGWATAEGYGTSIVDYMNKLSLY